MLVPLVLARVLVVLVWVPVLVSGSVRVPVVLVSVSVLVPVLAPVLAPVALVAMKQ